MSTPGRRWPARSTAGDGLEQGGRPVPGVSRGTFGGFCCSRLLVELFYRLFGGLPPLRGQRTGPAAYRAVAVAVRVVVLQRGGQQPGQRSRPASGRARDRVQSGRGAPERIRDLVNVGFGWNGELSQAAKPVELTSLGRHRGAGRRRPGGGQVPAAPRQRAAAGLGALVVGRLQPRQQAG